MNYMLPLKPVPGLQTLGEDIKRLPETMWNCLVDDDIIQRLAGWINEVAAGLA